MIVDCAEFERHFNKSRHLQTASPVYSALTATKKIVLDQNPQKANEFCSGFNFSCTDDSGALKTSTIGQLGGFDRNSTIRK